MYPTTPLDRAIDNAITVENARHLREDCEACLGFGYVERSDGPPSYPDRPRPRCASCDGTGRK